MSSKQFPNIGIMTPAQQRKAIGFLKREVRSMDASNYDESGYCNHEDTTEIRAFLIEIGQLPDRRKGKR